ncbi:carboxymuconolactone decarboxylase family protein [Chitinophaga alhagiae]|uniref:carboxymuconolactone decarboxylase family protein n=1 Tax=Chitinophaga alhagiae TaxID=2203219 RepID=UPI000E5BC74A|nr:carboxymuconolactone decarboxylase family protein [Chitinophaga alhagiae]
MEPRISYQDTPKGFMDGLLKTGSFVRSSGLNAQLQELVYYRVSQINGCAFCIDMHYKDAIHRGESEQRLHGLAAWRETPYYTEAERAALAYADALTIHCDADDEVYEALTAHFSREDIANLTLAIATINTWNRLNKAFRTVAGNYKVNVSLQ